MDWPNRDADLHELSLAEWGRWDETLGSPNDYREDLLASYVSRKRWEYREQAQAHFSVYAEMTSSAPSPTVERPMVKAEKGVNYGPPPFNALAKAGFMIPQ